MATPRPRTDAGAVRLCGIRDTALSVAEVLDAVSDPACGAQVLFVGRVRDHDHARGVRALSYEAHPDAAGRLALVCADVAQEYAVPAVAAIHRVGDLEVGDIAVVVAAAAAHREAAFAAGAELIERLKAVTPIWKHQHFTDGDSEWVGLP